MKRNIRWIIGLLVGAIALATVWVNRQILLSSPSTPEQRTYLPTVLADTSSVIILLHPKCGGDVLCVITSRTEVAELVAATELSRVQAPGAGFGFINLDFVRADGTTNTLNYKAEMGDMYVKFKNEWSAQGIPSRRFVSLVNEHMRAANTASQGTLPRRP
jgi:hypothetical protein